VEEGIRQVSDRWKRWRAYADDLEDALRWAAADLSTAERMAAEEHDRDAWPLSRRRTIRTEIVRRVLDTPVLGDLLRTAARAGIDSLRPRHDATLRPWSETNTIAANPHVSMHVNLRAIAPPPSGDRAPQRLRSAERALAQRTRSLVPVLEQLTVPRNASAVMRTAEGLGLQEMHFVDASGRFLAQSSVSKRAEQWLDLQQSPRARLVLEQLRGRGYRILAADFGAISRPVEEVEITDRVAVVFGSEQRGVSAEVRAEADDLVFIPIAGFSTYLNVSVAAAIVLYALDRRQSAAGLRRPLDEGDLHRIRVGWYRALASGRFEREVEYARWLHRPPQPADPSPLAPGRERSLDLDQLEMA
jgi:tRNA (guanosine-2'-O-)-methyltransferase